MARTHKYASPPSLTSLGLLDPRADGKRLSGDALPRMDKFRFQLFAEWIVQTFPRCRVADVGGGKGMLAYLLQRAGFESVVIDPISQELPEKYKDLRTGKRIMIPRSEKVPRLSQSFDPIMTKDFDLLVAMHAHGSNVNIIDSSASAGTNFAILPCCVIDEPIIPKDSKSWFELLSTHAQERGHSVGYFHLNFRGQNVGIYSRVSRTR